MQKSLEDLATPLGSKHLRRWALLEDNVLVLATARTIGVESMQALAAEYVQQGEHFKAAKTKATLAELTMGDISGAQTLFKEAHALLEKNGPLETRESQQLDVDILNRWHWILILNASEQLTEEAAQVKALQEKTQKYRSIYRDPVAQYFVG